jgi:hypothetical protein
VVKSLAFFEFEDQHAKLHIRGVERDEFARVVDDAYEIFRLLRARKLVLDNPAFDDPLLAV